MWWSIVLDIGMYSARCESGVTSSSERRLSTTNSLHASPGYRCVSCLISSRSRFDLPDSLSPKTRKNGSWSKSRNTGSSVFSSSPNATPRSGKRSPAGSSASGSCRGSSRTLGAPGAVQCRVTSEASAAVASARSESEVRPSMRGTAAMKCSFCGD